jgi:type IV pilus assembly protein PilW
MIKITMHSRPERTRSFQQGLTLIELMVAVALLGLVTMATVALYSVNSQSYKTVDASQSLDDNGRFAFEVIGQAIRNTGYREFVSLNSQADGSNVSTLAQNAFDTCTSTASTEPCVVLGFDNSKVTSPTSETDFGTAGSNASETNLSDSLALRFYGSGAGNTGDGTIINCLGTGIPSPIGVGLTEVGLSLFWIRVTAGEPELVCTTRSMASGSWSRSTEQLVRGVETFQVVYGVDTDADSVPNRWVSAANVGTWQNVRGIRIGMVMRGAPGSAQQFISQTYYPLGQDFIGSSSEVGYTFVAPADGRLRRVYTTTFMLRNSL